jgi:hypothetical protein
VAQDQEAEAGRYLSRRRLRAKPILTTRTVSAEPRMRAPLRQIWQRDLATRDVAV